jgi:hypothetical protein
MIRSSNAILALLASGAAGAAVPIFAAKCPNGVTADSNTKGQVYVSGKVAKLTHNPSGQLTAQSAGVYVDITPRGSEPPRVTSTGRDKTFVECEIVSFKAPDGPAAGAPSTGREPSAVRAGRGQFEATGFVDCSDRPGQPMRHCPMGVARDGGGTATVVVTRPDGRKRAIFFEKGRAVSADLSQADGNMTFMPAKSGSGIVQIDAGDERYVFPESVVFGG